MKHKYHMGKGKKKTSTTARLTAATRGMGKKKKAAFIGRARKRSRRARRETY